MLYSPDWVSYALAKTSNFVNDITEGNNKGSFPGYGTQCAQGFHAAKGWDPVTGETMSASTSGKHSTRCKEHCCCCPHRSSLPPLSPTINELICSSFSLLCVLTCIDAIGRFGVHQLPRL